MPFSRKPRGRPRKYSGPLQPGKKSAAVPKTKPKLTQMIKTVALKQCETKRSSKYQENVELYHNQSYYQTNLLNTTQGKENPSGANELGKRVGQEVLAKGLSLKLWISNKGDRPNVMYKIIVFKYPTRGTLIVGDAMIWQGTDGAGGMMNRMIDSVATNRVHVLCERMILPEKESDFSAGGELDREKSHYRDIYIPLRNRKTKYIEPDSFFPQDHDIGFLIVGYDAYGTASTDQVGSYAFVSRFYYKDP